MKILHLSKMDSGGGAADGFVRIHRALLGQGHDSVAYVIKQKRQDVPAMVDARRLLSPVQKLVWGLGRIWAKLSRLHLKPVGVYDFDGEANFPAEPIIRDARAHSAKWDLVVVHWAFLPSVRRASPHLGRNRRGPVGADRMVRPPGPRERDHRRPAVESLPDPARPHRA